MTAGRVTATLRAARIDLLEAIEQTAAADLRQMIAARAAIDHGGHMIPPGKDTTWGPQFAQLHLLGVTGFGGTEEAAIADWCAAVGRMEIAFQDEEAAAA